MMMQEFIDRTGFEPTHDEYAMIEEAYYRFEGSKDAFCEHFVKSGEQKKLCQERARKIEELKSKTLEMERDFMATIRKKDQEIVMLTAALNRELEWTAYESPSNTKQADYDDLKKSNCTRTLADEEAAALVADEFGFDRQKIVIVHEVAKCEINRHQQLRRVGNIERVPLYAATDWNYIRFNVRGNVTMCYEMHNGELSLFCD